MDALRSLLRRLANAALFALAILVLLEEWLWDTLRAGLRALSQLALVRAVESWLKSLSPWPAAAMLCAPAIVLVPFKFAGMWALAHGHWLAGMGVVVGAKVAGTALAAFVFGNVRDAARKLAWFDRVYLAITRVVAWAHAWVRALPAYQWARAAVGRAIRWAHRVLRSGSASQRWRRWAAARRLARARR